MKRKTNQFTLIELLIVIAVISMLISILIPSIKRAREISQMTVCSSNLKQFYTASMINVSNTEYLPNAAHWGQKNKTWQYTISKILDLPADENDPTSEVYSEIFDCPGQNEGKHYTYNQWAGFNLRTVQNLGSAALSGSWFRSVRLSKVTEPQAAWFIGDGSYWLYNLGFFGGAQPRHKNKIQGVMLDGSITLLKNPEQTTLEPTRPNYWAHWAIEDGR